jgi:invasion protein IalB
MYSMTHAVSRLQRVAALSAAAGFALIVAGLPALAQDPKAAAPAAPAAPAAAPAAKDAPKDAAKDAKKSTQWVKLCDKITINAKAKDGKDAAAKDAAPAAKDAKDAKAPATETKELCSTMFEAIESNTGQLIVSVGLQEIEGAPKQVLAVMVPLGVVIPGGVKLAVYNADQWARAAKNETIELKDLKSVDLKFSHCLPIGCTAETEATKEVTDTLKSSAGLAVLAIWTNGRQFTVPVPLNGFADSLTGKPVDSKEYSENRRKLMEQIRQHQIELANKAKAEEMKNLPPPPASVTTPAPAAPAPSAKK